MCNNLYEVLLQYFDSPKIDDVDKENIKSSACRYSVTFLIPYLEERIYNCENDTDRTQYWELWQKAFAFASRRSLEHFIDYMEMDLPIASRVLGNRRNVLKPFVFYLNKCAFDPKLQYIEASFPPRIWKKLYIKQF